MFTLNFSFSVLLVALLSAATQTLAFTLPRHGIPSITCRGNEALVVAGGYQHRQCHARKNYSSLLESSVNVGDAATDSTDSVDNDNNIGSTSTKKKKRMAILLCPAQFCVPLDYTELLTTIQSSSNNDNVEIVATRVAPLPRTEWIKVAKQLPTKDFVDANLSVKKTLDWYFDAMEVGLAELWAEGGEDCEICVMGHSIGGWVARAYLGGLSG